MEIQAKMQALVDKFHESGKTQKDFALEHGVGIHKFHYWVKKLSMHKTPDSASGFIRISAGPEPSAKQQFIELIYPNGVKLKTSSADTALLKKLISLY